MSAEKFWDKQAAKYVKSAIRDEDAYREGLKHTIAHLHPEMNALEFGCGTGMTAVTLAPHVSSYLATDVSGAMIDQCEKRLIETPVANVQFQQGELSDSTFQTGAYDVVLGFNILHLIPDVDKALAHAYRLLKPGGMLITKTTCSPRRFNLTFWAMLKIARVIRLFNPGLFVRIETVEDLDARVAKAGFTLIETGCYPNDPPARFIVARKP